LASPILDRTPLRKSLLASITHNAKGLRRRGHPAISREAEAKKLSCLFRHTFLTAHIRRLNPELMRVFPYLVVCMEVPEPRQGAEPNVEVAKTPEASR